MIAQAVHESLNRFDGIVIAHGTDTMAYTASALSFMMGRVIKPVVLTGSQSSILDKDGDSRRNMIDAFLTASSGIAGVLIVFNGKIMLGCRAVKVRSKSFNAFESINYPYIGYIEGGKINQIVETYRSNNINHSFNNRYVTEVFLLKLIPGTNPEIFDVNKSLGYQGIVIEGFGLGGVPFQERNLLNKIANLVNDGMCIVATTQCLYEGSDLTVYEVGRKVLEKGVILGFDMTTEAIVAKMMWALGQSSNVLQVMEIMTTNYVDEVIFAPLINN
jgi:L-asparaginase